MPEGPELRVSRDALQFLVGRRIESFDVGRHGRYAAKHPVGHDRICAETSDHGLLIEAIEVHGKFMWWKLEGSRYMHVTYGMTGQWRHMGDPETCAWYDAIAYTVGYRDESLRATDYVHLVDQRHFGTVKFVFCDGDHHKKLSTLGIDLLLGPALQGFLDRWRSQRTGGGRPRTACEVLMSQTAVVAGVGNYVKCEALYRAGIHPLAPSTNLSDDQLASLHDAVCAVLRQSYSSKGATLYTYKNVDGSPGRYTFELQVYGKSATAEGRAVERLKTPDGRTTWWCPSRQQGGMP